MNPQTVQQLKDLAPVIVAAVQFFSMLVVVIFNSLTLKATHRNLKLTEDNIRMTNELKQNEEKRKDIYRQVNAFYAPFMQLRAKSRTLRQIIGVGNPNSRLLIDLLNQKEFSRNDQLIIDEIISIGNLTSKLIMEQSGIVDDRNLRDLLSKALVHYTLIEKARNKELDYDVRFEDFVFPNEIDDEINKKLNDLTLKLNELDVVN